MWKVLEKAENLFKRIHRLISVFRFFCWAIPACLSWAKLAIFYLKGIYEWVSRKPNSAGKKASTEKVVKKSKTFWRSYVEGICEWVLMPPSNKASIYWLVVTAGSFIHQFLPLPQSYLSNKRNVFNVHFVKLGWGWTLGLLIPFISLTSSVYTSFNPTAMLKHLSRMAVGTFGWYVWVNLFVFIEEWTGQCVGEETLSSKKSCRLQGYHWDGFDISEHHFLLIYSALVISEEIQVKRWWSATAQRNKRGKTVSDRFSPLVNLLFICIGLLLVLWEFMLVCTTVYFHTVQQKVLGALVALVTWYVTYGVWYENERWPGRPWIPQS